MVAALYDINKAPVVHILYRHLIIILNTCILFVFTGSFWKKNDTYLVFGKIKHFTDKSLPY